MPENESEKIKEAAPVTQTVADITEVIPPPAPTQPALVFERVVEPVLIPAPEPVKITSPNTKGPEGVIICPECGQACGSTRKEFWGHLLGKHREKSKAIIKSKQFSDWPWQNPVAGQKKKAVAPGQPAPVELPPPDFSDITGAGAVTPEAIQDGPAGPKLPDYKQLSELVFGVTTGTLSNVFGPEWQPKSEEEKNHVCTALAIYMASKELPDIPPGLMLAIVCVAYAAPRLQAPTTKEKIGGFWLWLKSKVTRNRATLQIVKK